MAKSLIKKATGKAIIPSGKASAAKPYLPASTTPKPAAQSTPSIPKGGMKAPILPPIAGNKPKTLAAAKSAVPNNTGGAMNWGKGVGNNMGFPPGVDQSSGGLDSGPPGPTSLKTTEKVNMKRGDIR